MTPPPFSPSPHLPFRFSFYIHLEIIAIRQGGEGCGGQALIPVGDRGDVVLEGQVATATAPAQCLNGHLQIFAEADGVGDVPAIHAKALLRTIDTVRADHLVQTGVGRAEFLILFGLFVFKIVGTAEIILGASAADGGPLFVAIHKELDLAFAPPTSVVDTPRHVDADIVPLSLHAIENCVVSFVGQWVATPELSVEVADIFGTSVKV